LVLFYGKVQIDSLLKNNLCLEDVHEKNVMYDEQKQRWEIIDGDVSKGMSGKRDVQDFLFELSLFKSDELKALFDKFYEIARKCENYTDEYDQRILFEVANYKPEYISLTSEAPKKTPNY